MKLNSKQLNSQQGNPILLHLPDVGEPLSGFSVGEGLSDD